MDQLTQEIYTQLLELYVADLEIEVLAEKLKNVTQQPSIQPITPSNPWDQSKPYLPPNPWNTPFYYGPPYEVTCSTGPYNVTTTEEYPAEHHMYSEEWDAWYDPHTNEWLENKCSDPECVYCVSRPERPLP